MNRRHSEARGVVQHTEHYEERERARSAGDEGQSDCERRIFVRYHRVLPRMEDVVADGDVRLVLDVGGTADDSTRIVRNVYAVAGLEKVCDHAFCDVLSHIRRRYVFYVCDECHGAHVAVGEQCGDPDDECHRRIQEARKGHAGDYVIHAVRYMNRTRHSSAPGF
jgi:hypothetical protein